MARLDQFPDPVRSYLAALECPTFESEPWVEGPPLAQRRIAIISTAGLHPRNTEPFTSLSGEYKIIPGDIAGNELVMSHISTNFDRTGFQQDLNVVFPIDRLRELADKGIIGSVAEFHYSFMGASDPMTMEAIARNLSSLLKKDHVNGVLLVPI
jgi:D-proline reductase (dithiol) PrdB